MKWVKIQVFRVNQVHVVLYFGLTAVGEKSICGKFTDTPCLFAPVMILISNTICQAALREMVKSPAAQIKTAPRKGPLTKKRTTKGSI